MNRRQAEALVDAFDEAVCRLLEYGPGSDEQHDAYDAARRALTSALTRTTT